MKRLKLLLAAALVLGAAFIPALPAVAADGPNLVLNPSHETISGSVPTNWSNNKWGTNTATFSVPSTGAHSGTRSVRVVMSAYTSGDAKWSADLMNVTAGKTYTYSDWYKASVATSVVVAYSNAAGTFSYAELAAAPASNTTWTQYTGSFTVPSGITKATVYHLINKVGNLTLDDVSLTENGVTTPPVEPPTGTNLFANPSTATTNGSAPANWSNNKWGTNTTTFAYNTTGRTDARSVKTTTTAYTDGDAKWFPNPVAVTAGKTYTYSDWYKASIGSSIVVAYISSTGAYTYAQIGTVAASNTTWTQYTGSFTVPVGTSQVTVYHLIAGVGNLNLDDVSLTETTPTTPPASTTIPNSSVEEGGTTPNNWQSSGWGTNTAAYQYVAQGRTGSKSVKVTVSNYTDGDAKWMFNPISTLTPGKQYRFTTWYKTDTLPKVVAMYNMPDGTSKYFGMPAPQPAANASTVWQQYSDTFSVPLGTSSVSIFMFLDRNGWVQTDDYSLADYSPTGFNAGLLTLTFDDGHEENAANALPLLEQYGMKSTQCFATDFIEGQPQSVLDKVLAFKNAGHEICSHTVTHPALSTVNASTLTYELQHSQQYLQGLIGSAVPNFASPYGDYNAAVNTEIKKYYASHRTVDEGFNSKDNYDPYRLRVQNIFNTTTAAEVSAWVAQAKADKTWLILVYHRITNDPGQYDSYINVFQQHLQAIQASGIPVKTFQQGLTDTKAQL